MNVNLIRLKGVIKELSCIRRELSRIADCYELELAQQGIHVRPPKADTSGPPPEISYTDEVEDYINEMIERENERAGKAKLTEE